MIAGVFLLEKKNPNPQQKTSEAIFYYLTIRSGAESAGRVRMGELLRIHTGHLFKAQQSLGFVDFNIKNKFCFMEFFTPFHWGASRL